MFWRFPASGARNKDFFIRWWGGGVLDLTPLISCLNCQGLTRLTEGADLLKDYYCPDPETYRVSQMKHRFLDSHNCGMIWSRADFPKGYNKRGGKGPKYDERFCNNKQVCIRHAMNV